jgi:peptidoglycan/LPS O-acetylase OafA/YrhL
LSTISSLQPASRSASSVRAEGRIATLDGWRGVAILLVLISHGANALRVHIIDTGAHGVAIFFVLSGFLITSRMVREQDIYGSFRLKSFYGRRFFRLMPCAWIYLLFVSLLGAASKAPNDLSTGIPASLFFYRNFIPSPAASVAFTGHFWSLSIEEQFYLVWPALFLLMGSRRALQVAVAITALIALLRWHDWNTASILKFETQYHADSLLVGCMTAILLPHLRPILKGWTVALLLPALLWCFPRYSTLTPLHESLAIAGLLVATSSNNTALSRALEWKPLAFLGTISYSLYIWQQPFEYLTYKTTAIRFAACAILLLIALASHYLVERPIIRLGAKLMKSCDGEIRATASGRGRDSDGESLVDRPVTVSGPEREIEGAGGRGCPVDLRLISRESRQGKSTRKRPRHY